MSHKGIRQLIEDTAKSLGDDVQFTYGRTSDFNMMRNKRMPYIVLDLLSSVPTFADNNVNNYIKTWSVGMGFYDRDDKASTQDQYAKILDDMDEYVDRFINKLNTYAESRFLNSDHIVIANMSQQPFIKATADVLTGYVLTFRMQVNDQFNYCGLDC